MSPTANFAYNALWFAHPTLQASLVGHHGSMTPGEQLVPLLVVRA